MAFSQRLLEKRMSPIAMAEMYVKLGKDPEHIQKKFINAAKGWGVFATCKIPKGSFLVEYRGEIISKHESTVRETRYKKLGKGNYMYTFCHNGEKVLDATKDDGSLGRLVNDSLYYANARMKKIVCFKEPKLCLFAIKDIDSGEEISYDYGVPDLKWREKEKQEYENYQNMVNKKKSGRKKKKEDTFAELNTDVQESTTSVIVVHEELPQSTLPHTPAAALMHVDFDDVNVHPAENDELKDLVHKITSVDFMIDAVTMEKQSKTVITLEPEMCMAPSEKELFRNTDSSPVKVVTIPTCKKKILDDKFVFDFKDFNISSVVGEGRFAKVVKATCPHISSKLALRSLKLSEAAAVNKRKLQKEVKQLVSMDHKNIVKCFGVVLAKSMFVLEYCGIEFDVDGEQCTIHSLLGLLRTFGDDLLINLRLSAISDVAAGLAYLHSRSLVAGDLKPANVLINGRDVENVTFKLSDLNFDRSSLTSTLKSSFAETSQKEIVYTMLYLAPELISSELGFYGNQNSKTDIFAFAILMFEVMFPEEDINIFCSPIKYMEALRNGWRPEVPILGDEYLTPVIDIMRKSWNQDSRERPSSQIIQEVVLKATENYFPKKTVHETFLTPTGHESAVVEIVKTMVDKIVSAEKIEVASLAPILSENICSKVVSETMQGLLGNVEEQIEEGLNDDIDNQSLDNDSGLHGDFPDIDNTDLEDNENHSVSDLEDNENHSVPNPLESTPVKIKGKKKPYRFCIFCKCWTSYLRRHIVLRHKADPEVKAVLGLSKPKQLKAFQVFRRKGIFEVNVAEAKKAKPCYERDKERKKTCRYCLL